VLQSTRYGNSIYYLMLRFLRVYIGAGCQAHFAGFALMSCSHPSFTPHAGQNWHCLLIVSSPHFGHLYQSAVNRILAYAISLADFLWGFHVYQLTIFSGIMSSFILGEKIAGASILPKRPPKFFRQPKLSQFRQSLLPASTRPLPKSDGP
jgi:hypothetical protein